MGQRAYNGAFKIKILWSVVLQARAGKMAESTMKNTAYRVYFPWAPVCLFHMVALTARDHEPALPVCRSYPLFFPLHLFAAAPSSVDVVLGDIFPFYFCPFFALRKILGLKSVVFV